MRSPCYQMRFCAIRHIIKVSEVKTNQQDAVLTHGTLSGGVGDEALKGCLIKGSFYFKLIAGAG